MCFVYKKLLIFEILVNTLRRERNRVRRVRARVRALRILVRTRIQEVIFFLLR